MKPFNLGLSIGSGGIHFLCLPAIEMKVWRFNARANMGWAYMSFGLDYELLEIKSRYFREYLGIPYSTLLLSGIVNFQGRPVPFTELAGGSTGFYQLLVGLKNYSTKHFSYYLKAGIRYSRFKEFDYPDYNPPPETFSFSDLSPYLEAGVGISLFKNYEKIKK